MSISDSSPGVTIHYTTNGTTPTASSTVYTGPIVVKTTTTIKAMAEGGGFAAGAVRTAIYTLTAATPVFSPVAGTYHAAQSVSISDSSLGVTIHYTTNGTTPTTASTVYTGRIAVKTTTTIKAIAVGGGFAASAVGTATYTLTAATPFFSPVAATYHTAQSVTIADTSPGVAIHYTTNGTTPTTASTVYTAPIAVKTTTTIKAVAVGGGFAASAVRTAIYTLTAATPVFNPVAGTYHVAQSVSISDSSPGVTIHYTTNGTTPTTSSTVYTGRLAVKTTTTIKAMAAGAGFAAGAVASATYTIQ